MTKDEVLQKLAFLDQVAGQAPVSRGVHVQVQAAVGELQEFIRVTYDRTGSQKAPVDEKSAAPKK